MNTSLSRSIAPERAAVKIEPRPANPHVLQAGWLNRARGCRVKVRLTDGRAVSGVLSSFDTYAVQIVPSTGKPLLIYKHAVAYFAYDEGEEASQ